MARRADLKAPGPGGWTRSGGGLLLVLAVVVLVHALALEWMARQRPQASVLQAVAAPMFTRLLQPDLPPPAPVSKLKVPVAPVPRSRSAINFVAPSKPAAATPTAAAAPTEAAAAPLDLPAPDPEIPQAQAPAETPAAPATADPAFSIGPTPAPGLPELSTAQATPTTPAPDSWPADTRLNYALSGRFRSGDLYGDARVQWQRSGERYQVRIDIDLSPWVHQVFTSQGIVTPSGLQPQAYEESRRGKNRGVRLEQDSIRLDNGRSVGRPQGVQDTASQFVELSHRFASGQDRLEVGQAVSFWMARPGAVDLWTYDVVERVMLRTARLGEIEAFHLRPRPIANPRGNITAEMWFAPSLQYLPVRIQVKMGDEAMVDLLVDTIEQR